MFFYAMKLSSEEVIGSQCSNFKNRLVVLLRSINWRKKKKTLGSHYLSKNRLFLRKRIWRNVRKSGVAQRWPLSLLVPFSTQRIYVTGSLLLDVIRQTMTAAGVRVKETAW